MPISVTIFENRICSKTAKTEPKFRLKPNAHPESQAAGVIHLFLSSTSTSHAQEVASRAVGGQPNVMFTTMSQADDDGVRVAWRCNLNLHALELLACSWAPISTSVNQAKDDGARAAGCSPLPSSST
jgi:hypothetical protein